MARERRGDKLTEKKPVFIPKPLLGKPSISVLPQGKLPIFSLGTKHILPKKKKIHIHRNPIGATPSLQASRSQEGVDLMSQFDDDSDLPIIPKLQMSTKKHFAEITVEDLKVPQLSTHLKPKVSDSWNDRKLPRPLSKLELDAAITKYKSVVEEVLEHDRKLPRYFDRLKQFHSKRERETVRDVEESWQFPWTQFYAGYLGLERQFYIGENLMSLFGNSVLRLAKKNNAVLYFTVDNYCKYILALEVVVEMTRERFGVDDSTAMLILADTVDYGHEIADKAKLE